MNYVEKQLWEPEATISIHNFMREMGLTFNIQTSNTCDPISLWGIHRWRLMYDVRFDKTCGILSIAGDGHIASGKTLVSGLSGQGLTRVEAVNDLCRQLSNHIFILNPFGQNNRAKEQIVVPKLVLRCR